MATTGLAATDPRARRLSDAMRPWPAAALALALSLSAGQAGDFFTLKGHGGPIKAIAAAPDGQILTASFDNSVGLWQAGAPRWLEGHRAAVNAIAFAGDGRVISAGDDNDLRLWSLGEGTSTRLAGHTAKILGLAVAPSGNLVASASWDGRIGLWDLDAPEAPPRFLTGHTAGVNDVAFSADGRQLYSGSTDGSVRVWDVASGDQRRQLINNGFGVNTLVLDDAAGWLAYGAVDGVTRVIDLDTGDEIRDLTFGRRPVLALALDGDRARLAIGDGEGYISIIETGSWRLEADFRATLRGPVWALAFSPDGTNIHAGGLDTAMYSWPLDGLDGARMVAETPSYLIAPEATSNGERQYNRKCSICHALGPDRERRAGPTLHGVFGRPAGSLNDFPYSETLLTSGVVWSADTIDQLFHLGPDAFITGSNMPEQRITDAQDRADLISFLRAATGGEPE